MDDVKRYILALISGIVLLVVGLVVTNVSWQVGNVVQAQLNASLGNISGNTAPLINGASVQGILQATFIIGGIVLLAYGLAGLIRYMMAAVNLEAGA